MNRIFSYFTAGALLALCCLPALLALPSFSRAYRTSCVTCHVAFPRRNAVGEAFRLNGFRFEDDESYRKDEPVELGDEAYKKLWPKAIWPSHVPSQMPFSVMTRFLGEVDMDGSRNSRVIFLFPEELELVWGGIMGDDFTFYGDIIFIQKDFGGQEVQSWATMKAWLGIEDLFGPENMFNLRLGSVGTQTMGLYSARDSNTFTTHYYLYTGWAMPKVKLKDSELNDFRGNPFTIWPQVGVELNGFGRRWKYSVAVVSGNVENPTTEAPSSSISFVGTGRNRGVRDFYFETAYKFGGLGFDGSGAQVDNPLQADPQFWRDDNFTLSLWGYRGVGDIEVEDAQGNRTLSEDDFWRLAIGAQQQYKDLTVGAGYMFGKNDNPYGILSDYSVDSRAWYAEALYFALPWLIPYVRYEGLDLDLPAGIAGLNPDQDNNRVVIGCKTMIRANVALNVEGNFYTKGAALQEGLDQTLFVLLNLSF